MSLKGDVPEQVRNGLSIVRATDGLGEDRRDIDATNPTRRIHILLLRDRVANHHILGGRNVATTQSRRLTSTKAQPRIQQISSSVSKSYLEFAAVHPTDSGPRKYAVSTDGVNLGSASLF